MVDFRELLSKPADKIEPPKVIPPGTYYGTLQKFEFKEANNDKKTPYCEWTVVGLRPGEQIDPALVEGIDFTKETMTYNMYLSDKAQFSAVEFLEGLGIKKEGRTLGDMIPEALNQMVMVDITNGIAKKSGRPYATIDNIKAAQ